MPPFHAIIIGAGPGVGRSLALRFASHSYGVVLLSRRRLAPSILDDVRAAYKHPNVSDAAAATAATPVLALQADAADPSSLSAALDTVGREWPGSRLAVAVYNANAGFAMKPFLELKNEDLTASLQGAVNGFFNFAQATIPHLLSSVPTSPNPPTLLVTGASASLRGSARFSTFAAGKFAQRAVAQSLAREFGPRGVHVALAVIDGGIDVPGSGSDGGVTGGGLEDAKLSPDAIAESYWNIHTQHRSAWTFELDLRPYVEKW